MHACGGGAGDFISTNSVRVRFHSRSSAPLPHKSHVYPHNRATSGSVPPKPHNLKHFVLYPIPSLVPRVVYISTLLALCASASQPIQSQGTGAPRLSNLQCLACPITRVGCICNLSNPRHPVYPSRPISSAVNVTIGR